MYTFLTSLHFASCQSISVSRDIFPSHRLAANVCFSNYFLICIIVPTAQRWFVFKYSTVWRTYLWLPSDIYILVFIQPSTALVQHSTTAKLNCITTHFTKTSNSFSVPSSLTASLSFFSSLTAVVATYNVSLSGVNNFFPQNSVLFAGWWDVKTMDCSIFINTQIYSVSLTYFPFPASWCAALTSAIKISIIFKVQIKDNHY
jgi:hypothetical protein